MIGIVALGVAPTRPELKNFSMRRRIKVEIVVIVIVVIIAMILIAVMCVFIAIIVIIVNDVIFVLLVIIVIIVIYYNQSKFGRRVLVFLTSTSRMLLEKNTSSRKSQKL